MSTMPNPKSRAEPDEPRSARHHRWSRSLGAAATLTLLVTLSACRDAAGPEPVAHVQVNPSAAQRMVGQTLQLSATVTNRSGKTLSDRSVTWSSANASIAVVDANGMVTTQAPGTATITASCDGVSGAASLTVLPVPVASVEVEPATAYLAPGDTIRLTAITRDSAGGIITNRPISWHSNTPTVAGVDANGLVNAVASGATIVSATSEGKTDYAVITVHQAANACDFPGATLIAMGQSIQGFLTSSDCPLGDGTWYDLYRFNLTTTTTVRIDLTSSVFDAYLFLMTELYLIDSDDDSGGNRNARIVRTLPPGTYYIAANNLWVGEAGAYTLTLTAISSAGRVSDGGVSVEAGSRKAGLPPKLFPRIH